MIYQIFVALGNNRPQILIQLEDHILMAIVHISEGLSVEDTMEKLYSQILSLEKDLASDDIALSWFNLSPEGFSISSTSPPLEISSTPLAAMPNHIKDGFQG
jgi:hypothetical protein